MYVRRLLHHYSVLGMVRHLKPTENKFLLVSSRFDGKTFNNLQRRSSTATHFSLEGFKRHFQSRLSAMLSSTFEFWCCNFMESSQVMQTPDLHKSMCSWVSYPEHYCCPCKIQIIYSCISNCEAPSLYGLSVKYINFISLHTSPLIFSYDS